MSSADQIGYESAGNGNAPDSNGYHVPVLLKEVIDGLNIRPGGVYLDGTAGGGGHAAKIAERLNEGGMLICLDQDADAIAYASGVLAPYSDRVKIIKSNFSRSAEIVKTLGVGNLDGILLDLGVSSHQVDDAERGFSYRYDAALDMRMDRDSGKSAFTVVNEYPEAELVRVIRDYGEERYAKRIAAGIVRRRRISPVETTFELADIVKASVPVKMAETGGHPAKRTFQAIRIEVNDELNILEGSLASMIEMLSDGGRLCVITFHSLEDRIVKRAFKTAEDPCVCPKDFPVCVCGRKSKGRVITRKPVTASLKETERNNRAHSAKLRIFERKIQAE